MVKLMTIIQIGGFTRSIRTRIGKVGSQYEPTLFALIDTAELNGYSFRLLNSDYLTSSYYLLMLFLAVRINTPIMEPNPSKVTTNHHGNEYEEFGYCASGDIVGVKY